MATSSLYDTLTKFSPDPYPSGDMIKSLIELLSGAASSSVVARNTHTLCTALSRSREIFNTISTFTKESLADNADWTSFDKYTKLIDPLEEFLLKLAIVAGESYIEKSTETSATTNIDEWITAGDTWVNNRTAVTEAFDSLLTDERFKDIGSTISTQDKKLFRNHDDDAFLDELIRGIDRRKKGNDTKFSVPGWRGLADAQKQIKEAQTLLKTSLDREDESVEYAIHLALIVNGIVEVTSKTTNEKLRKHLGSEKVLAQTLDIASSIVGFVKQGKSYPSKSRSELETKWTTYEVLLRTVSDNEAPTGTVPLDLGDLRKLPAKIRPPYFLQSLILVTACRDLIKKQAEPNSKLDIEVVRSTVTVVVDAFRLAAALPSPTKTGSLTSSLKSTAVDTAYTTALEKVKGSFTTFKLTFDSSNMSTAKTKDNERLADWEDKLTKASKDAVTGATTEITVSVKALSGPTTTVQKVYVSETATLDTVLWRVCNEISDKAHRERLRSGYFMGAEKVGRIEVSELVSKITKSGKGNVQLIFD